MEPQCRELKRRKLGCVTYHALCTRQYPGATGQELQQGQRAELADDESQEIRR